MTTTIQPTTTASATTTRLGDPTKLSANARTRSRVGRIVTHVCIIIGVLFSLFPFYWLLVMSTQTTAQIFGYPPRLVPSSHLWANLTTMAHSIPLFQSMLYSLIVSLSVAILVMFFDSLAAFAFGKYEFPGKNTLFILLLATFLVPGSLSLVPSFVLMSWLGWTGSFAALIVPGAANAFGIFLLRQFAQTSIPNELVESARVDGAGFFRIWWSVAVPMMRGGIAFLGIFTFITTWNDYVWPLIILVNPQRLTLQVALSQLNAIYSTNYGEVMAGAVVSVVPLIGIFIIGSRHFIANIAAGALKG